MTAPEARAALQQALLEHNPFRDNRVSQPSDLRVDVDAIHATAFQRLLRRVDDARTGSACGVLLTGIAGCGKSHLIARLMRHASTDRHLVPVFLHNLQASPERIPRYLLKATVSSLLGLDDGAVLDGLRRLCDEGPPRGTDPLDAEIHGVLKALLALVDDPDQADLQDAAVSWLSGEELDEDQVAFLYALAGRPIRAVLPDTAAIERVLLVLTGLFARDGRVLVLCLDQIDNLDADLVAALTSFLHALLDHATHLLVICSGVTTTMAALREVAISEAAWDRIAQYRVELQEITAAEAETLLERRLAYLLDPVAADARDPLFPLGRAWFDHTFTAAHHRPRDVITAARDAWEGLQIELERDGIDAWLAARAGDAPVPEAPARPEAPLDEAIRRAVRDKVDACIEERRRNPASLPPDADNLASLVKRLLQVCVDWPGYSLVGAEAQSGKKRAFDLVVRERASDATEARTGVLCLPGGHGNTTTAALRRAQAEREGLDHVVLATDTRRPFKPGAKGKEYYTQLSREGEGRFRHLQLDLVEVAHLDALVSVLGLARVGDLEVAHGGRSVPVSEAQAARAMHELDLLRTHPLLADLLTEPDTPQPAPDAAPLDDDAVRQLVAGHLSWRVGASTRELARRIAQARGDEDAADVLERLTRVTDAMHREGTVQITPLDNERYVLWLGTAP
ncbi:MAG: ATP-binding protein [Myxococcota bacterium]